MIKKITIEVIPNSQQRYGIVGDYLEGDNPGEWKILLSDGFTDDELFALLTHELWEWFMAIRSGVKMADIDTFETIPHPSSYDPDLDPKSPVHVPARFALGFERVVSAILGFNHEEYEAKITAKIEERERQHD